MNRLTIALFFIVITSIMTACNFENLSDPVQPVSPINQPSLGVVGEDGRTTIVITVEPQSSDLISTATPLVPRPIPATFQVDQPLYNGDTSISGVGEPNLLIEFYDVGTTGRLLAETQIGPDGTFEVTLDTSLKVGQRVALSLGSLSDTEYLHQDFESQSIEILPIIGYIFTDIHVQPK